MEKPVVYNWKKAEERIRELEEQLEQNKTPESFWHEDEAGIWCDRCDACFQFDKNLQPGERYFEYCPDCGARMEM